jgi:uncharacterized protein YecT (DUF1311 family)
MRPALLLAVALLIALVAPGFAQAGAPQAPDCSSALNTPAMNACYKAAYDAADARLNERYKTLMARLGKSDQDRLRDAQRAWVAFRDKQCAFETASYSTGSIYPLLVTNCLTELTQQRTQTFDHYLDCRSGDTSCVPLTEVAAQPAPAATPATPTPATPTAAAADNAPCRQTTGAAKAQQYVQQCTEVSPATHPPCNAQNACGLMIDEIKRGCAMIGTGAPAFCASYK